MSKLTIYILLAIAAGLAIGYAVQLDPGYIRLSWMNYLVETTVWVALILIIAVILIIQLLLKMLFALLSTRAGFRSWRQDYADARAHKRTQRGLVDFAEGRWDRAQRRLVGAADRSQTPMMSYLTAAQAASEKGDVARCNQLLNQARDTASGSDFAVDLTRAQMYVTRDQYAEAKALLLQLNQRKAGHSAVLRMLRQCMLETGDWAGLVALLPALRKHLGLSNEQIDGMERSAWFNLLDNQATAVSIGSAPEVVTTSAVSLEKPGAHDRQHDRQEGAAADSPATKSTQPRPRPSDTAALDEVWSSIPQKFAQQTVFMKTYLRGLEKAGALGEALAVLRRELKKNWNGELAVAYVQIATAAGEADHARKDLRKWQTADSSDPDLKLALGIAAEQSGDLDDARSCLEDSLRKRESSEAYEALGRVASKQGDHAMGARMLELALQQTTLERRLSKA